MANKVQYGLRPAQGSNNIVVRRFYCDGSNNNLAIGVGDIVKGHANGGVIQTTAGVGVANVGVVVGCYDTNKIPCGAPSSAVSSKYLPASTVGYVDVALFTAGAVFVGQSLSTAYAATDVFAAVNIVVSAVDTVTGHSTMKLGATGGADLRILGLVEDGNHAWGAINADVYVTPLASIFFGASTAI